MLLTTGHPALKAIAEATIQFMRFVRRHRGFLGGLLNAGSSTDGKLNASLDANRLHDVAGGRGAAAYQRRHRRGIRSRSMPVDGSDHAASRERGCLGAGATNILCRR